MSQSLHFITSHYRLLWSNIKVPTGIVNQVQLTTTRVILISPRKWSGLGQYQYQTLILLSIHKRSYRLLWSNIKVPTGIVNQVQLTTTRVILISPRKWSGLGQYRYQTFCCTLLKVHKDIIQGIGVVSRPQRSV